MTTQQKTRRRKRSSFLTTLHDDPVEDAIILADMRERVRMFGTPTLGTSTE